MRFSQKVQQCHLSPIRKFHPYAVEAAARGVKIYRLNIGQPDIPTPQAYFQTLAQFSDPVLRYAPSPGIPDLIQAVQGYYARLGVSYDESEILITTGGSEALLMSLMCILDPGDEVIVPEPFYPNYNTFVQEAGGVIRPMTTTPEDGYYYADRWRLEALINERTRAIICTNPGNPTGVVLNREELLMFAEVAKAHNLFLISDEVYREFIYSGDSTVCIGALSGFDENTVLIDSVSKRFSACGARIGALITRNKELQQHALKLCQARLSVASVDQAAAAALYTVEDSYFTDMRDEYQRRRDTVCKKLSAMPGVVCDKPAGAFYLMAKLPVDNTDSFQKWLLTDFSDNNETLMFAPGESFYGTPGLGLDEIRIAYVLNCADLERSMDLLALGIQRYNQRNK